MDDVDDTTPASSAGKRKKAEKKTSPIKEHPEVNEDEEMIKEFQQLYNNRAQGTFAFTVVALAGKNKQGGVYVPQECVYIVSNNDVDQTKSVQKAIVEKAREWRKACPDISRPCWLIEASGLSSEKITAVGGVDMGCKRIPTISVRKAVKQVAKKAKKSSK